MERLLVGATMMCIGWGIMYIYDPYVPQTVTIVSTSSAGSGP
jgi:hypothetical protein